MKRGAWPLVALLSVVLATQVGAWLHLHRVADRASFVVLPHSVVLENAASNEAPSHTNEDPVLAGLTADDVVRGLLVLAEADDGGLTAEQAKSLLPDARRMLADRRHLLTLRHDRHAANEAAMEDALGIANALTANQLRGVIDARPDGTPMPVAGDDWLRLLKRWGVDQPIPPVNATTTANAASRIPASKTK